MAIEKYSTESFILSSFESGENDRTFKLFTKEFGLLNARATSVRKENSKLRAHLHEGRLARVTLVKGKEIWRIVGGEEIAEKNRFISEVSKIIERFVRGGGQQKRLFEHMYDLSIKKGLDERMKKLLAYYLILVDLGYADAEIIGAENISEYKKWEIDQFYTQLILARNEVKEHIALVLKEMHL